MTVPIPNNFALSNLVVFAGVASTFIISIKNERTYNPKNPYLWVSIFFLIGTIGILIYGFSMGSQYNDTSLVLGYSAIFIGVFLILAIIINELLSPYQLRDRIITRFNALRR